MTKEPRVRNAATRAVVDSGLDHFEHHVRKSRSRHDTVRSARSRVAKRSVQLPRGSDARHFYLFLMGSMTEATWPCLQASRTSAGPCLNSHRTSVRRVRENNKKRQAKSCTTRPSRPSSSTTKHKRHDHKSTVHPASSQLHHTKKCAQPSKLLLTVSRL